MVTEPQGVTVLPSPVQAQRRSREHSRSASALSISGAADEKSEPSDGTDQRLSYYSNGGFFTATATGTALGTRGGTPAGHGTVSSSSHRQEKSQPQNVGLCTRNSCKCAF